MELKIFSTAADNGDGSNSIEYYESQECIDKLEEYDPESYRSEGGRVITLTSDSPITMTGLKISTMEDVDNYLIDMGYLEEK